jgi:diadenosine tetraphosphate (Ap4A) HIT family hydrolase
MKKCSFCAEFNSDKNYNLFHDLVGARFSLTNRVIQETNQWIIIPSLGSFWPGYVLILPKKHFFSVGAMPEQYYDYLQRLLRCVKGKIQRIYSSKVIAFEHGAVSSSIAGGACSDHAHIHLLPYSGNILSSLPATEYQVNEIYSFNSLKVAVKNGSPYLFYQSSSNRMFIIRSNEIPSQIIRKIIAKQSGIPDKWDWKNNLFHENIISTINDLHGISIEA